MPGAAAVYLFREEDTEDKYHTWSKYVRLKVLTERGKEYGNVELRQIQAEHDQGYKVGQIEARTIHADGTVIPFTGTVTGDPGGGEAGSEGEFEGVCPAGCAGGQHHRVSGTGWEYYDHLFIPPSWLHFSLNCLRGRRIISGGRRRNHW